MSRLDDLFDAEVKLKGTVSGTTWLMIDPDDQEPVRSIVYTFICPACPWVHLHMRREDGEIVINLLDVDGATALGHALSDPQPFDPRPYFK